MEETVTKSIWDFGSSLFTGGLLSSAIFAVVLIVCAKVAASLVKKAMHRQEEKVDVQNRLILRYIEKTIVTIVYVIVVFSILGRVSPLQSIGKAALGATSILAVAVSLAAQETFGNYIAGFFIALYHPFKVGDNISLPEKGITGVVSDITLRHTEITTVENTRVMIPNSIMNTAVLENRAFGQDKFVRYEMIGVAYDSDIDLVRKIVCDVLEHTEGIVDTRTPEEIAGGVPIVTVQINAFLDSAIEIKFPIRTVDFGAYYNVAPVVREQLLKAFRMEGVEIPFPVRTIINK